MTKIFEGIIGCSALNSGGGELMKFDPFDGASWREKLSDQGPDGTVTVTLSTGRQVTVNSRLLALLRLLADELAREETQVH
ncbi:MAG TPA: hypothetical protein DDZ68_15855 [Parvularcula sp.]|nr:hypothetical protein [Parvularcula sp.]